MYGRNDNYYYFEYSFGKVTFSLYLAEDVVYDGVIKVNNFKDNLTLEELKNYSFKVKELFLEKIKKIRNINKNKELYIEFNPVLNDVLTKDFSKKDFKKHLLENPLNNVEIGVRIDKNFLK